MKSTTRWLSFTFMLLIISILLLQNPATGAAQSGDLQGEGQACFLVEGGTDCCPLTFTFNPNGGSVVGSSSSTTTYSSEGTIITSIVDIQFSGDFDGGNGGAVSGRWDASQEVTGMPVEVDASASGTWQGNFYANGTGNGTISGSSSGAVQGYFFGSSVNGTWNVSYSPSAFTSMLATPAVTQATATITLLPPTATEISPTSTLMPTEALFPTEMAILTQIATAQASNVSGATTDSGGAGPEEIEESVVQLADDLEQAAGNPLAPVAGGLIGALAGGLLSYLVSTGALRAAQTATQTIVEGQEGRFETPSGGYPPLNDPGQSGLPSNTAVDRGITSCPT